MRKMLLMAFALLLLLVAPKALAAEAEDITADTAVDGTGYSSFGFLTDRDVAAYRTSQESVSITLTNDEGMGGLYIMFDLEYGSYTLTDPATGTTVEAGTNSFLHEYIDLQAAFGCCPRQLTLDFSNGKVRLSELQVFGAGAPPASVQLWQPPLEGKADIVLFSTHGDDEHLYFAGLLPQYATREDVAVQVVYLTDHRNDTYKRTHEMLNGLWNVGVRAYPVFGSFADFRVDDLEYSYRTYERTYNTSREELQGYVVEQLRRFKPQVAVGHDIHGEYGHGMHQVYTDLLIKALPLIADGEAYPESARRYGIWELPKLYLHLYEENTIILDYDQPLEAFDGLTAFQVSQQLGFPSHNSQQWDMFVTWIYGPDRSITRADQITTYNPAHFGLYHTTVGADVEKNDFLENIVTYARQEQLEQEQLEQERLEQERLEQEQQTEPAEVTQPAKLQASPPKTDKYILYACAGVVLMALIITTALLLKRKR